MITTNDGWTHPRKVPTRFGDRTLRALPLTKDHDAFKAWAHDKKAVKGIRFQIGKAWRGYGFELCHWENVPGQFEVDIEALNAIIKEATREEEHDPSVHAIDYVAEDFDPLVTRASSNLFSWQRPSCQRLVHALMNGNALDASQTGAGKTFIALATCAELGLTPYVIAPLAVLEAWRRAATFMGVVLGGVSNYDKARAGSTPFIAKNPDADRKNGERTFAFQPIPPRSTLVNLAPPDVLRPLLIFDEVQKCFPYDTIIRTNAGPLPIGYVVEKRLPLWVSAWNETAGKIEKRRILNHWKNQPGKTIILHHEHGSLRCTPTHQIWTEEEGWKAAQDIREGQMLRLREHIRGESRPTPENVWNAMRSIAAREQPAVAGKKPGNLDTREKGSKRRDDEENMVQAGSEGNAHHQDEAEQSDARPSNQSAGHSQASRADLLITRRERRADEAAGRDGGGSRTPDGARNRHPGRNEEGIPVATEMLQSGYRRTGSEAGDRDRRSEPQHEEVAIPRPQEGSHPRLTRLVRVEIPEQGSRSEFSPMRGDDALYDIEVEGLHNYFADGVLVHNCKSGSKTLQGRLMIDTVMQGARTLFLSATAAKDPTEMEAIGLALGLHEGGKSYTEWMKRHGCKRGTGGYFFTDNVQEAQRIMQKIHRTIFPAKGTRIRSTDVPGYPENAVTAHLVENQSIVTAYEQMKNDLEDIEWRKKTQEIDNREAKAEGLAAITKARRASEYGKIEYMIDETKELLADGFQVAVFLNFREHLAMMRDALKLPYAPIWGTEWLGKEQRLNDYGKMQWFDIDGRQQKPEDRTALIDAFQSGKHKVVLVSLMAGGAGISLHDEQGIAPRQSLISPSYSAIDLVQGIGRIWRAGSKSKATQRIIYAAGTIEEEIAASVTSKIEHIETLNDGDLLADCLAHFTSIE